MEEKELSPCQKRGSQTFLIKEEARGHVSYVYNKRGEYVERWESDFWSLGSKNPVICCGKCNTIRRDVCLSEKDRIVKKDDKGDGS